MSWHRSTRRPPAQGHLPVVPSLAVAREVSDRSVEVVDRFGRSQRSIQRAGDALCLRRQRLLELLAQLAAAPGCLACSEAASRMSCLLASSALAPSQAFAQGPADAGVELPWGRCSITHSRARSASSPRSTRSLIMSCQRAAIKIQCDRGLDSPPQEVIPSARCAHCAHRKTRKRYDDR